MAKFCIKWQLIGKRLKLTEGDITAIDGDYRSVEEKRVGMLERWKNKFAYKATYLAFIKALLADGRSADAIDATQVIKGIYA